MVTTRTMSPRKRQLLGSPPRSPQRKSARLAAQAGSSAQASSSAQAGSSALAQSRAVSGLSTNTESSLPESIEAAKKRITKYQSQNRLHEENLQPSLNAFLEWLPEGGRESIARDIINATTDKALYDVFNNLLTGLVLPSKFRLLS